LARSCSSAAIDCGLRTSLLSEHLLYVQNYATKKENSPILLFMSRTQVASPRRIVVEFWPPRGASKMFRAGLCACVFTNNQHHPITDPRCRKGARRLGHTRQNGNGRVGPATAALHTAEIGKLPRRRRQHRDRPWPADRSHFCPHVGVRKGVGSESPLQVRLRRPAKTRRVINCQVRPSL
jgi:hypothetical protein